jgi:hypothetical protein
MYRVPPLTFNCGAGAKELNWCTTRINLRLVPLLLCFFASLGDGVEEHLEGAYILLVDVKEHLVEDQL